MEKMVPAEASYSMKDRYFRAIAEVMTGVGKLTESWKPRIISKRAGVVQR
jgi:hypothetical protein